MGWWSLSFHTGHLAKAHGRWVGLLAKVEGEKVSFRFVRNSRGADLWVEGDEVFVRTLKE
jgi:hypothetical protein